MTQRCSLLAEAVEIFALVGVGFCDARVRRSECDDAKRRLHDLAKDLGSLEPIAGRHFVNLLCDDAVASLPVTDKVIAAEERTEDLTETPPAGRLGRSRNLTSEAKESPFFGA